MRKFLIVAILWIAACSSSRPTPVRDGGTPPAQPAATPAFLSPDEFDAASPISVAEAEKARAEPHGEAHAEAHAEPHADAHAEEHADTTYVCPMHPDVTSHAPGKCPKCGMQLVPRRKP